MRSFFWRLGRKLYCVARRERANDPQSNGEYWLLEKILSTQRGCNNLVLMDIGANIGDWSEQARSGLLAHRISGRVVAFEPACSTFKVLNARFAGDQQITCTNIALSSASGESDFYIVEELAGTNSLYAMDGSRIEKVRRQSLDDFMAEAHLPHVAFAKCDTEGHDLDVTLGF